MHKAVVLLRETDHPIKWVAIQCGYRRVHSFNKAFKNYSQLSPGVYRRRSQLFAEKVGAVESNIDPVKSYIA
jgi:AraC-like DNA-binding protein